MKTINEQGWSEVVTWIKNTQHDSAHYVFDDRARGAWTEDIENSLAVNNLAIIEMPSTRTASGHTETYTISPSGITEINYENH